MLRRLALAALVACALPSSALAAPSVSVEVVREGPPGNTASKVRHRLTITAGATPETVELAAAARMEITGAGVTVDEQRATGPGVSRCAGRWERPHAARERSGRSGRG